MRWLAALALAGACVGSPAPADPFVFVLAGQSNMAGYGLTDELPEALATLPPNVRLFVDGEAAAIRDRRRFGPEVAFAHELAAAWPERNVVLLKYAVGGTSLLAWAPEWDADEAARTENRDAGPLYRQLLDAVHTPDLGPAARYAALLWMQGERDARYADTGAAYLTNLETFLAATRRDLGVPDLPFLLGLVNPPSDRYPAADVVRDQQRRAPDVLPATTLVDTDGVTMLGDNLHFDTAGQIELGRRFARAYLALGAGD